MDNIFKNIENREFVCRQCNLFLDTNELIDGKCPECLNDKDLFINDLNNEN